MEMGACSSSAGLFENSFAFLIAANVHCHLCPILMDQPVPIILTSDGKFSSLFCPVGLELFQLSRFWLTR